MSSFTSTNLRRINPRTDLNGIADLIELCFGEQMDADGRAYLRRLREAAQRGFGSVNVPAGQGFVWVEDGQIVGNITMIAYLNELQPIYLLANIAVHPDFRQRGIARQLTQAAMQSIQSIGATAWLHVRQDNPIAIQLYQTLGFVEQARRSTWTCNHPLSVPTPQADIVVRRRQPADWPQQLLWLEETYPTTVRWNLPFRPNALAPGLWHGLLRWLNNQTARQCVAWRGTTMLGSLACEETTAYADVLWPACAPTAEEDDVLLSLLAYLAPRRPLIVNYPAGRGVTAFLACGFELQHTLIWMKA
jgi:predicted N-acetyltransferase YhbS